MLNLLTMARRNGSNAKKRLGAAVSKTGRSISRPSRAKNFMAGMIKSFWNRIARPTSVASVAPEHRAMILYSLPKPTDFSRLPCPAIRRSYKLPMKPGKPTRTAKDSRPSRLRWNSEVSVVEIASHREYTADVKKTLYSYSRGKDVRYQRLKNQMEYYADGSDWRKCREEDEFVEMEGKLVHPYTAASLAQGCWLPVQK